MKMPVFRNYQVTTQNIQTLSTNDIVEEMLDNISNRDSYNM